MFKMNKPLEKKLDKSLEKKQELEHTTLEKPEAEKFLSKDEQWHQTTREQGFFHCLEPCAHTGPLMHIAPRDMISNAGYGSHFGPPIPTLA